MADETCKVLYLHLAFSLEADEVVHAILKVGSGGGGLLSAKIRVVLGVAVGAESLPGAVI